ncbi:potassium channel subfamily T member 1-like isoform X4 [Acanthaster planci]|uniref:Potassium channel subfamily T member 1-like isoform X4 n=1 Tax=Acanthaster planci TaxID=133434 RepID=A0A8B7YT99_ACAPL|nr:potassium channel subfamily T member 1-like isoform X4 [Acanthaster planci]
MAEGYDIVPPLPPRYRFRDLVLGDHFGEEDGRVRVEFFVNEQSFRERLQLYFIKNKRSSVRIRLFNLFIKLVSCLLYVVRILLDTSPKQAGKFGFLDTAEVTLGTDATFTTTTLPPTMCCNNGDTYMKEVNWAPLIWVNRNPVLWAIQLTIAIISLSQALLLLFLQHKGSLVQQVCTVHFFLELLNTVPFIITIFWPPLRNLFIPVFLNCWLAKDLLQNLFNDLHRVMQRPQSALSQQLMILLCTILCLIFTSWMGIHHLERGDGNGINIFHALYFTLVTFSTVGYGDIHVDIWPSQLFIMIMIGAALVVLPIQLEKLAYVLIERQKQGGTYSQHRAESGKHVVVCATVLQYDLITDFLNEFYAHNLLHGHYVVLVSPCELDNSLKALLQVPLWAQRVIYIQGSVLKDQDLIRINVAQACFILSPRNVMDRSEADQQTILRTWAVKDFAPNVPLYVQILKPENKFHVQFADHVVCEDEIKYALLANNCLCPGTSTFVTLLIHTSRGQEGSDSSSQWQRTYGRCSGNEVYHIKLGDSRFFGEYEGKSFTYASFHAHKKYGVSLIGIQKLEENANIQLNPGPRHIMRATDTCFYLNITKEENSAFILRHPRGSEDKEKEKKKADGGKSSNYVPPADNGGLTRVESAIASVGTLALELHHMGGKVGSPTHSAAPSPVKSRESFLSPEGRESAAFPFLLHSSPIHSPSGRSSLEIATTSGMDRNHLMPPAGEERGGPSDNGFLVPAGAQRGRRPSIMPVLETMSSDPEDEQPRDDKPLHAQKQVDLVDTEDVQLWDEEDPDQLLASMSGVRMWTKGEPPTLPYIGYTPAMCHLLAKPKKICCLELDKPCEHCSYRHAAEYNWPNNNIIIAAEYAAPAMVNFVVPLRAHWRPKHTLKPIVILLEKRPDTAFLDCILSFPMVYYMIGTIENYDDVLRAGILQADTVVVVDKESSKLADEDYMADANQIVAVQTLFKLFPHVSIITELTHPSNMRFMQFRAKDVYALKMADKQKKEKAKGSNIAYMFRLPFSAGNVFSASMLDTLLYQSYVKSYMISFTRLLLGLDQAPGSGYLCELRITAEDMWIRTYGRLYQKLCSTTHEIPIGVYRTHSQSDNKSELSVTIEDDDNSSLGVSEERKEIASIIRMKMQKIDLPAEEYDSEVSDKRNKLSYVLINPSFDLKLEMDDVIFIIKPAGGPKTPSPMPPRRKFSSRRKPKKAEPRAEPQGSNVDTKL